MQKPHFLSLSPDDYAIALKAMGEARFRADQIVDWVFKKGALSPDDMSNLGKALRDKLREAWDWSLPQVVDRLEAQDGSTKLLLKNAKGQMYEAVIMRYEGRTSLCVSSQVGCKLACSFCQTGKLGFFSHLSQAEILAQFALANRFLREEGEGRRVSHVVFMGMGEPFDNYDNTVGAANTLIDEKAFGLSARHVTLSTSGMAPRIRQLAQDSRAALALSLHASRDDLRTELMPINRKYDLAELKDALLAYQKETGRKVTIEYILIQGKNCGLREAKELVRFLAGLRAKVNLIPFNAHPGVPYQRPDADEIRNFQKYLADRSIPAPVRYSKGLDVSAACGQLAAKNSASLHTPPERKRVIGVERGGTAVN